MNHGGLHGREIQRRNTSGWEEKNKRGDQERSRNILFSTAYVKEVCRLRHTTQSDHATCFPTITNRHREPVWKKKLKSATCWKWRRLTLWYSKRRRLCIISRQTQGSWTQRCQLSTPSGCYGLSLRTFFVFLISFGKQFEPRAAETVSWAQPSHVIYSTSVSEGKRAACITSD